MSRSKRKPWVTDNKGSYRKIAKKLANKRVRAIKNIASGNAYKKEFQSWDICDYKWYEPKNEKIRRK